jgi:hypothetical protein
MNGKAKGQRPLVKGKRKPLMSKEREKGDGTETDDPSEEEEEVAENDNDEEVEKGGDGGEAEHEEAEHGEEEVEEVEEEEAAEEDREEEGDTEKHNAAKDVMIERNTVEDFEKEHVAEEQGDDRNDGEQEEAQAKGVYKRKDSGDQGEQDREKDDQDEEEREKEAERDQEVGEPGDMVEKPSETKAEDDADKDKQADGTEDDEEAEAEMEIREEVREDREAMEQRVTADNRDGAWRDCRLADITDKEGEERDTGSGREERMAGEENGDPEERRKRPLETCEAFDCPTPGDRPNKRSRSNEGKSEDGAATEYLTGRTFSPETTPRLTTPSPTFIIDTPGSTLEIVRQTSVVSGLEDTKSAVWKAAQRDSIISSLPVKEQAQMVRTALSLGSEEDVKELKRFVSNARTNGKRGSESLVSEFKLITFDPDSTSRLASNALVP